MKKDFENKNVFDKMVENTEVKTSKLTHEEKELLDDVKRVFKKGKFRYLELLKEVREEEEKKKEIQEKRIIEMNKKVLNKASEIIEKI